MMAKTYKKISGTWYPIKKIFKRIGGTWSEIKKLYKKVNGTWQVVHTGAYEYTFTANASNVNFATLIGAAAVANNTDFIITINAGVTLSGTVGVAGANNASTAFAFGNVGTRVCKDSAYADGRTRSIPYSSCPQGAVYADYYTGNGGTGGNGSIALDLSGMSGKNITIINNGVIQGGNGGIGGIGAIQARASDIVTFVGCSCGLPRYRICGTSGNGVAGAYGWSAYESGAYDMCG